MTANSIKTISIAKIRSEYEILSLVVGLLISFAFLFIIQEWSGYLLLIAYIVLALILVISYQGQILGNSLQVNWDNFPELKKIIERQALIAGIPEPNLFIMQTPVLNAFSLGFYHPYTLVVHSSIIELFSAPEIEAIIAHELGHVYFGHPRISSLLSAFQNVPLGFLFLPIELAFNFWSRQAEKSSDRFSVGMTGNPRSFVTSQIKLSAGPKFINQIDEVALLNQSLEIQKNKKHLIGEWFSDHPYSINRIAYSIRFADDNGLYYRRDESVYCVNCGKMIKLPAKYCDQCGWVIEP
jgi:Zn-dependent protease with chaperone function